jgi:hypothetical protein
VLVCLFVFYGTVLTSLALSILSSHVALHKNAHIYTTYMLLLQSRFTHIERNVRIEMNKVSMEHLSVASAFVSYMSTLVGRKERDLDHLAARLLEHGRQRIDAIERDNADDVRRADRDKEETLKGQQVARRNLESVRAQKTRALSDLVGCLVQLGNRPLPLALESAARDAYALARKEAQNDRFWFNILVWFSFLLLFFSSFVSL